MTRRPLSLSLAALLLAAHSAVAADGDDIRKLINDAIAAQQSKVTLPPGEHRIEPPKKGAGSHLNFSNANNLEIDGNGATLVFTDPETPGLVFNNSRGLTLRNFKIDYEPLPFTQGTITAIEKETRSYAIAIDAGYLKLPTFFAGSDQSFVGGRMAAYLFDGKTGEWKTDAYDMYPSKFEVIAPNTVRLGFATPESFARNPVVVGDRIVISRRTAGGMRLNECTNTNVDGVTIYACGGIGVQEAGGPGQNRFKLTVTRGPIPPGATAPRLHSINADGFHSSAVTKGPIVEDSLFEWMGDDAIAVHGTYALATAQPAPDQITLSPKFEQPFRPGDDLTIVDGKTYKVKATAKVTKAEPAEATHNAEVDKLWETYRVDQRGRKFFTISVDKPTPINVGDLITSPQRIGNGYVVRNNVARHHRARGIQMKAGDGIIENNTIEDVNMAGITLGPELSIWLGSDYVKDVVVRNNTIRGTGRGGEARRNVHFADIAAIVIRSLTLDHKLSPPENARIVIEGNRIERPAGLAMFLSSTTDLTVRNNTIVGPWSLGANVAGKRHGVDTDAAVFVANCVGVKFANNTVEFAGGNATKPIAIGADVEQFDGADTGFTIKTQGAAKAE